MKNDYGNPKYSKKILFMGNKPFMEIPFLMKSIVILFVVVHLFVLGIGVYLIYGCIQALISKSVALEVLVLFIIFGIIALFLGANMLKQDIKNFKERNWVWFHSVLESIQTGQQ